MAACADKSATEEEGGGAATIEPIEGTDLSTVTLTAEAAQRIDLQTAAIEEASGNTQIPYAAVLYDPDGATWAFVKADGLTFQREPITVDHIDAGVAFLTERRQPGPRWSPPVRRSSTGPRSASATSRSGERPQP